MKVLITNYSLAERGGTEIYVRDLAFGLLKRGHTPIVYSPELGVVAREIREATIPVVDDLDAVSATPDVIHGQHYHETMTALLRFPDVPAIYVCHDWYSRLDAPPPFPRIMRYVAVDQTCYEKLVYEKAIPEERVRVFLNFVELERFKPRAAPLPARPKRALMLCNYTEEGPHLNAAREACASAGVTLDVLGARVGRPCAQPERVLGDYDIVLAKGRTALEALAVGASVILFLNRAVGPMVTSGELDRLLPLNFGIRSMRRIFDPDAFAQKLSQEIARYDPADAELVTRRIRASCGREGAVDEFVSLYEEAINEYGAVGGRDVYAEARAASAYVRELLESIKAERAAFHNSNTFRLKERFLRAPLIGKLSHKLAERFGGRPGRRD